MRTAPTLEHPELISAFAPLLREMNVLNGSKFLDYYDYAFRCAISAIRPEGERDDLSRVKKTKAYKKYLEIRDTEALA